MPTCSKGTLTREHPEKPGTYQYLNTSCKKLSCNHCGPQKAAAYRTAIVRLAAEHKLQRHVILTLDPGLIPKEVDSVDYIQQVWSRFRTWLHDQRNITLHYVRVLEFQSNGTAHFHLLIHETFAQDTLLSAWVACGGGHQVRIRFRDGNRGANYVAKYVTKELLARIPPRRRRVATSRTLVLFIKKAPGGWTWTRVPMWLQIDNAFGAHFDESENPLTFRYFESTSPPLDDDMLSTPSTARTLLSLGGIN